MKRFLPALSSLLTLLILLACAFPAAPDAIPRAQSVPDTDCAPAPDELFLSVYVDGALLPIALEAYVAGVVRAEMPLSYAPEALKAQAIAARTYAVQKSHHFSGEGCASHPQADICAEPGCCQGYEPSFALDAADEAALATAGQVLIFRGHPIRALYHACAGGHTEDAENVFSSAIAYLRGVPSPGEEGYDQYSDQALFDRDGLQVAFQDFPDVELIDGLSLAEQIEVLSRSDAGRVLSIRVGLTALSGSEFRRALGLRSANFSLAFPGDSLRVTSLGSGHGVGMSQTGADAMARSGADCEEILKWYFTDVEIADVFALLEKNNADTD